MAIAACIFDLDGVIVDTAHYHFLAWKRLSDELTINFTIEDNERLKGVSRMQSLDIILSLDNRIVSEEEKLQLATRKNEWFVEYINQMTPADTLPGVHALLSDLQTAQVKVALASSSKNARTVLKLIGLEDAFEVVVDGTMIKNTKPDPEIFLLAAQRLKVNPAECVVVEDAEAGVEAAVEAGMSCIGIGSPAQLAKANIVVDHIKDVQLKMITEAVSTRYQH